MICLKMIMNTLDEVDSVAKNPNFKNNVIRI